MESSNFEIIVIFTPYRCFITDKNLYPIDQYTTIFVPLRLLIMFLLIILMCSNESDNYNATTPTKATKQIFHKFNE